MNTYFIYLTELLRTKETLMVSFVSSSKCSKPCAAAKLPCAAFCTSGCENQSTSLGTFGTTATKLPEGHNDKKTDEALVRMLARAS